MTLAACRRRTTATRCGYLPTCRGSAQVRVFLAGCMEMGCGGHLRCVRHAAITSHVYSEFMED